MSAQKVDAVVSEIVREVAELPNRNSPEGQPEMMLVTSEELAAIVKGQLSAVGELIEAVMMLETCPHIDLGDQVYTVREAEGLGWDGPAVKQWSDGVEKLRAAMSRIEVSR